MFLLLFSYLYIPPAIAGFSFSWSNPTECDQFNVSWQGGSGPYHLLALVPSYSTPYNYSIPDSSFNQVAGLGSFPITLNISNGTNFLLVMSDSTGFASGGVSSLLTVGPSNGGSCESTPILPPFTFYTSMGLQQCEPLEFYSYDNAIQPITIYGLIPSGEAFILHPPIGSSSYNWTANVAFNTSLIFTMMDSEGSSGGSTDVIYVDNSGDNSCLGVDSPSSTSSPTQTPTYLPVLPTHKSRPSSSHPSLGLEIGVPVGVVLLLVGAAIFLICRRRLRKRGPTSAILAEQRDAQVRDPLIGVADHGGGNVPGSLLSWVQHIFLRIVYGRLLNRRNHNDR